MLPLLTVPPTRWGFIVARHPSSVLLGTLLIVLVCCLGLVNFSMELRTHMLWLPAESSFRMNEAWLQENFPRDTRVEMVVFEAKDGDILDKEDLVQVLDHIQKIRNVKAGNITWTDVCWKIPVISMPERDLRVSSERSWDPSDRFQKRTPSSVSPSLMCSLLKNAPDVCFEQSILELWNFTPEKISALTKQDIVDSVNSANKSPLYGSFFDYSTLLGGISRNSTGQIVGASSTMAIFMTAVDHFDGEFITGPVKSTAQQVHYSADDFKSVGLVHGIDPENGEVMAWETGYLSYLDNYVDSSKEDRLNTFFVAERSFNDASAEAIVTDSVKVIMGFCLMFAYTALMIDKSDGSMTWFDRIFLTAAGITSVAMGLLAGNGIAAALGLSYNPINASMPFICLGIGIDDMFVIVQCWHNLELESTSKDVDETETDEEMDAHAERLSRTLEHAGAGITVTSVTDVFAFSMGSVSILPGLHSFCLGIAITVFVIFLLQGSWFTAWFSIIQRSRDSRKQQQHKNHSRGNDRKSKMFERLARTHTLTSFRIEERLDFNVFLPTDSSVAKFFRKHDQEFPNDGYVADIFIQGDPIRNRTLLKRVDLLVAKLQRLVDEGQVLRGVDDWLTPFKTYVQAHSKGTSWDDLAADNRLSQNLTDFLFTQGGFKYQRSFKVETPLNCGHPVPKILVFKMQVKHLLYSGPKEHLQALETLQSLVEITMAPHRAFASTKIYAIWELDGVIGHELWRNLSFSNLGILIISLVLLCDLKICLLVTACIIFSLVDTLGTLHYFGVTVNLISSIDLVMATGIGVDYSAHIALAFIMAKGTVNERASDSLACLGPAVANGAVTTVLAVILLAASSVEAFVIFFKVFFLMVTFCLFHGLIFLPSVLTLQPLRCTQNQDDIHEDSESKRLFTK